MRFLLLVLTLPMAAPAMADGFGFRTPSGNIYCNGSIEGGAELTCIIVNRDPGSSSAGFGACPAGREFRVDLQERGPVNGSCGGASGSLSSYTDVANYGVTGTFGRIQCLSEQSGFSCRNADGHGFFLSRRSQQVF
jgi:hypothetical protein